MSAIALKRPEGSAPPARLAKSLLIKDDQIDRENFMVRDLVISDGTIDRDEEIIDPNGYKEWLPVYRQNPIFCWGHPLSAHDRRPPTDCIGNLPKVGLVAGAGGDGGPALVADLKYAVAENETAADCWKLVAGGYLRSVSVGVIPHNYVFWWDSQELINGLKAEHRSALLEGRAWCVYTEQELVELSQCFVGSNRSSLIRAVNDGAIKLERAKSWAPGLVVPRYYAGAALKAAEDPPPDLSTSQNTAEEPETPAPSLSADELEEQEFEQFLGTDEGLAFLVELLED